MFNRRIVLIPGINFGPTPAAALHDAFAGLEWDERRPTADTGDGGRERATDHCRSPLDQDGHGGGGFIDAVWR